jgi:hypothetical protein
MASAARASSGAAPRLLWCVYLRGRMDPIEPVLGAIALAAAEVVEKLAEERDVAPTFFLGLLRTASS